MMVDLPSLRWLLLLLFFSPSCLSLTHQVDKAVLDEFYNGLTSKGLLPSSLPSDWCTRGITGLNCDANGKVYWLSLPRMELIGTIPSSFRDLTQLQGLNLSNNKLTGSIPSTLGNLSLLKYLYLSSNQLTGTIPSTLGNLSSLLSIALDGNQLTGSIPSTLGNISGLKQILIWNNQLTGTIPSVLSSSNLRSLELLYISGTNNFCPKVDYRSWAAHTDWTQTETSCTCAVGLMGNGVFCKPVDLAVIQNNDGEWKSVEVFLIDQNSVPLHNYQNTDGSWSGWINLASAIPMTRLTVAINTNGRLEAFGLSSNNEVYHTRQGSGPGGWNHWSSFGGWFSEIAVGTNSDGRLELVASDSNSRAWHVWEESPSSTIWSGWHTLSGETPMKEFSINVRPDGFMQVFALGTDQALYTVRQGPNGAGGWESWQNLGGWSSSMVSSTNDDGRLGVFAIGTDNMVFHIFQDAPNSDSWSSWYTLGSMQAQQLTVTRLANGKIIVFGIGMNRAVYFTYQTPSGWTTWQSLGGTASKISAITTQAGTVQVYAVFPGDKNIRVISQLDASNVQSWSSWTPLQ